ncbi:MAG: hypothetical protein WCC86_09985 [Methanoregula sp.]|jgi:hypothetical protein
MVIGLCEKQHEQQLRSANDLKMHQDNLTWVFFSIFIGASALLLGAYFQSTDCSLIQEKLLIVPLFGISISIGWLFGQNTIIKHYCRYEKVVFLLEKQIPEECKTVRKGDSTKKWLLNLPPIGMIGIWELIGFWAHMSIIGFVEILILPTICFIFFCRRTYIDCNES